MPDWSGTEIQEARERLEQEAALAIGRFIIEFGRLEMDLGLAIAWKNAGAELEIQTELMAAESFGSRLKRLREHVEKLPASQKVARDECFRWMSAAEALRDVRNQFIHGRWGIKPMDDAVTNVMGLPTSPRQHEIQYKVSELHAQVQRVVELRKRLSDIRSKWPYL